MNIKNKIIKTLLILIVIFIIIFLIWQRILNKIQKDVPKQENQTTTNITILDTTPKKENKKDLKKISDKNIIEYLINEKEQSILYISDLGFIYKYFLNENKEEIINNQKIITSIKKTTISPNKEKILIAHNNPLIPDWLIFDIPDKTFRPLNIEEFKILDAEFLTEEKIIALAEKKEKNKIIEINIKDLNFQIRELVPYLNILDTELIIISEKKLLLAEKILIDVKNHIFLINLENSEIKKIIKPEIGLLIKKINFQNNNYFLKYSYEDKKVKLLDEKFNELETISETIVSKCSNIENNKMICFKPKEEIKIDSYLMREQFSKDYINLINFIIDKEKNQLLIETNYLDIDDLIKNIDTTNIDATKIIISMNKIYFINRYDNNLYQLTLPELKN